MINYPIENDKMGIIPGTDTCVFIKTGRGGTIYGYKGKYLSVAEQIYKRYGFSVCVSSNPAGRDCVLMDEIDELNAQLPFLKEILFVGISNGALVGAQQAYSTGCISRMLLINGPLMINWHKTKSGIEKFVGKEVMLVYGEEDPSYRYYDLLKLIDSDAVECYSVAGADHNFANMDEKFRELILFFVGQSDVD